MGLFFLRVEFGCLSYICGSVRVRSLSKGTFTDDLFIGSDCEGLVYLLLRIFGVTCLKALLGLLNMTRVFRWSIELTKVGLDGTFMVFSSLPEGIPSKSPLKGAGSRESQIVFFSRNSLFV